MTYSTLENEAKKSRVSINTLVSQIFARYSGWDRYAGRLKLIPVSKDLLRETFQSLGRDQATEMGKRLSETAGREQVLYLFQELNLGTVLQFVDMWCGHFDAHEHRYNGKVHFYTVRHDINYNFSVFAKEYLTALLNPLVSRPIKFETLSPNSVTFSFEV